MKLEEQAKNEYAIAQAKLNEEEERSPQSGSYISKYSAEHQLPDNDSYVQAYGSTLRAHLKYYCLLRFSGSAEGGNLTGEGGNFVYV